MHTQHMYVIALANNSSLYGRRQRKDLSLRWHLAYANRQFPVFRLLLDKALGSDPSKIIFHAIERGKTEAVSALPLPFLPY